MPVRLPSATPTNQEGSKPGRQQTADPPTLLRGMTTSTGICCTAAVVGLVEATALVPSNFVNR